MTTVLAAVAAGKGPQNAGRFCLGALETYDLQALHLSSRNFLRFAGNDVEASTGVRFHSRSWTTGERPRRSNGGMAKGRGAARKVSCEDCFFRKNLLCALPDDEPCATFRPAHPDGLRPPRQLRFQFRQERRTQSVWAFPTAQEQAALHT
jgi:hypothetical protein